jgi:hypothetical protein
MRGVSPVTRSSLTTISSMPPTPKPTVKLRAQVRAFDAAVQRFRVATANADSDTYSPLAEALAHALNLDDRFRLDWSPRGEVLGYFWFEDGAVGGAETVPGVRWVRNAVHHGWSDALMLTPGTSGRFPPRAHEWVWRPTDQINGKVRGNPPKGQRDIVAAGYQAYDRLMAGRPADFTLSQLAECYGYLADFLEPILAPNRAVVAAGASRARDTAAMR